MPPHQLEFLKGVPLPTRVFPHLEVTMVVVEAPVMEAMVGIGIEVAMVETEVAMAGTGVAMVVVEVVVVIEALGECVLQ